MGLLPSCFPRTSRHRVESEVYLAAISHTYTSVCPTRATAEQLLWRCRSQAPCRVGLQVPAPLAPTESWLLSFCGGRAGDLCQCLGSKNGNRIMFEVKTLCPPLCSPVPGPRSPSPPYHPKRRVLRDVSAETGDDLFLMLRLSPKMVKRGCTVKVATLDKGKASDGEHQPLLFSYATRTSVRPPTSYSGMFLMQ